MILWIIVAGFIVGLTSGIPFGPVGALCIKRSLSERKYGGYFTGFGASTADGIFALAASFGINAISNFLIGNEALIQIIGGLFLIGVGLKEIGASISIKNGNGNNKKEFFSGLTVALASPFVIFSFIALYALLGMSQISGNYFLSLLLALFTTIGSFAGVAFLNWIVIENRMKIKQRTIDRINRIIGGFIFLTGSYLLVRGTLF
jgi:threonine/homoserine/homoserine lactone efflux protein